jgi:hypothetical protein
MEKFDSTAETLQHIRKVNTNIIDFCMIMLKRAQEHDESKLHEPEKELFDEMTPILKNVKYGTPEYEASLKRLQVALEHHYENNSHHPQYYGRGIDGMDLFDIIEMYCDWKAAVERTKDGSLDRSLDINKERFNISDQLYNIFKNTRL